VAAAAIGFGILAVASYPSIEKAQTKTDIMVGIQKKKAAKEAT
jgi:hypothetical protein